MVYMLKYKTKNVKCNPDIVQTTILEFEWSKICTLRK